MANAKSKASSKRNRTVPRGAKRVAAQRTPKKAPGSGSDRRSSTLAAKPRTKHDSVLTMLRSPVGATIAAMMKETGWQQHSVRGFLAGVVRKRLKLDLVSDMTDKGRVYRVKEKRTGSDKNIAIKPVA